MSSFTLAFLTGLFGSIHCLGMCGPLAFGIPSAHPKSWLLVWDKFIYQVGRVISYSALGLLVGLIGKQLWMAGLQQTISILSGMMIIAAACSVIFKFGSFKSTLTLPVSKLISGALNRKAGHLIVGMLNGLLPCGFVTLALAGAINTGNVLDSALYMLCFGAGTVPLMLVAALGTGWITPLLRRKLNKVVPYLMMGLGVWFVVRGLPSGASHDNHRADDRKPVAVCR